MFTSLEASYGSLALFNSILHNVFLLYHVDMFVSVYKIDKFSFWLGEGIFLIWNSLNDPLFGWFSDSKLLNIGKKSHSVDVVWTRLSALHMYGPLFALSFGIFWIQWAWPGLQFTICLCLYDGFLTMVDLHHSALLADLSVSGETRTRLNSYCSIFSTLGSASVFLSYLFWDKSNLWRFREFCLMLVLLSFAGYVIMVKVMKKAYIKQKNNSNWGLDSGSDRFSFDNKDLQAKSKPRYKASVLKFGKQLLAQKNFLWFALMNLVQVFHCHFNSNFFPLFLDTLLGDAVSSTVASALLGLSFVAPHVNNLYFLSLCRRYGVYYVIRSLFIVKLVLSGIMFYAGPHHLWLLCVFIASNRMFTEGTCKLLSLVISDLVDEDMVMHSRPQPVSALVFGTAALMSKPGQTLAPVLGTWILAAQTGHDIFQSGNEAGTIKLDISQMDYASKAIYRDGVFFLLVSIPVVCAVVQLLAWSRFTLKGHRLAQVKAAREGLLHSLV